MVGDDCVKCVWRVYDEDVEKQKVLRNATTTVAPERFATLKDASFEGIKD